MGMMPELRPGAGGSGVARLASRPVPQFLAGLLDPALPAAVWLNLFSSSGSWKLVTRGAFKT